MATRNDKGRKAKRAAEKLFESGDLAILPFSLCISDPNLPDNPLVYVSPAFETLTGYSSKAVVGKNCRFLQGEKTDPKHVAEIRQAIAEEREISIDIYNYRATGEGFWNRLLLGPLHENGEMAYFVGIQHEVTEREHERVEIDHVLAELQHRVKNHLSMVVGMIRLQSRNANGAKADFSSLASRVEALQLLYQELSDGGVARHNDDVVPLGAYVSRVASAVSYASGREAIRLNIDTEHIDGSSQVAGQVGLVVSELMTNSYKHAFNHQDMGTLDVSLRKMADEIVRLRISDDGEGLPDDLEWPEDGNLGAQIVRGLVREIGGKLSVDRGATGTTVTIDMFMD